MKFVALDFGRGIVWVVEGSGFKLSLGPENYSQILKILQMANVFYVAWMTMCKWPWCKTASVLNIFFNFVLSIYIIHTDKKCLFIFHLMLC